MNILYVEDESANADLTQRTLDRYAPHVHVDRATSRQNACERLGQRAEEYELVLIALFLPDGDGLTVLKSIRELGIAVAVVVITEQRDGESAVKSLKAGANDYFVRQPDRPAPSVKMLEQALQRYRDHTQYRMHPLRILYAEPNENDVYLTSYHLQRHAPYMTLDTVHTAQELLDRLARPSSSPGYDVLLLDYRLPNMNAIELLKELQEQDIQHFPIVVVTSENDAEVAAQALMLGASDYVVKFAGYLQRLPSVLDNAYHRSRLVQEQAVLRDSEQRLRRIVEQMPVLLDAFDENGTAQFWNTECERVTGYAAEEIVGNPRSMELLVPDAAYRHTILTKLRRVGHSYRNWEIDIRCKNGERRTISWSNISRECPIPGWWSWGVGIDVTERKRAEHELRAREEELRQNETRYKKAQEIGHVGNWEYDPDTTNFWGSDEAKRLYGFDPDASDFSTEEVGRCTPDFERVRQALHDLIEQGAPYDLEFEILPKDGRPPVMIHSKAELLRNADGAPVKIVGVIQDITTRKRAEDALKHASEDLQKMVKDRTRELREAQERLIRQEKLAVLGQMAGSVGHELRNPLATISNAVYYLKTIASDADAAVQEYLEIIAGETRNAEKIIHDLLDFARVKTLKKERIDLGALVDLVRERWRPPDNVQIHLDVPDEIPDIWADRHHLEHIMLNLLTNACEAMPQGGTLTVSARLSVESRRQSNRDSSLPTAPCVLLTVQDTGCGIPASHVDKLFEPLFTTKSKGIGLGLAISKNLTEANGGRMIVESKENHGSTFSLIFPLLEDRG